MNRGGVEADLMADFQQQRHGQLRHRIGAVVGHIAHGDSEPVRGLQIDHIDAGGKDADVAQPGQRFEQFGGQHDFVDEQQFRPGGPFRHLLR